MLGMEIDLVLSAILLVLVVMFLLGKGEGVLQLFAGKKYKKRDKATELRLQRWCALFCAVLMVAELAMAFLQETWRPIGMIYIVVVVVDLIIFSIFYRKNIE